MVVVGADVVVVVVPLVTVKFIGGADVVPPGPVTVISPVTIELPV